MTVDNKATQDLVSDPSKDNASEIEGKSSETKQVSKNSLVVHDVTVARLYNKEKTSERYVGRTEDLAKLVNCLKTAFAGEGKPLFIIGDPGIGKTELIYQFFANTQDIDKLIIDGRYFDTGSSAPYKVFLDGLYRSAPILEKQNKDSLDSKTFINNLKEISDISLNNFLSETNIEKSKYRNFELLIQSYNLLLTISPIILFLDDFQWADELSLEFIAYLIRAMQEKPFFLVCTIREHELSLENNPLRIWMRRMSRYNAYEQIKLRPLSASETNSLINLIFSANNFSEALPERLHKETGGNPYYLIEVIKQLMDSEKIFWNGDIWEASDLDEVQLPNSLVDLIELQLSRLSKSALSIFQQASVIGEEFSFELLQLVTDLADEQLISAVEEGLKQFLISEQPPSVLNSSEKYTFRYNTIRKVLYDKSSSRQRKIIHNKVAKILEEQKAKLTDYSEGNIAYHYLQAGEAAEAFQWSVEASTIACNKFAFDKAATFFSWASKALEILEKSRQPISFPLLSKYFYSYGQFNTSIADYPSAIKYLKKAHTIYQEIGDVEKEAEVLISIGNCLKSSSSLNEALENHLKALMLASKANLPSLSWVAAYAAARCEVELYQLENAIHLLKQALDAVSKLVRKSPETEKEQLEKSETEIKEFLAELEKKVSTQPSRKSRTFPKIDTKTRQTPAPADKAPIVEVVESPTDTFQKCILTFKQLHKTTDILNKLLKTQPEPPKIIGIIFSQLKQLKTQIDKLDPLTINTQLSIIKKQLHEYQSWLHRISNGLPPYTMRQYLEQGLLIQKEMLQLAAFLIMVQFDSNDDKAKVELLLTRALEIEVDREQIITNLFPEELSFVSLPSDDPNLALMKSLLLEIESLTSYAEIIESNLLNRIKQSKSGLGNFFWSPEILTLIIEIDLKFDLRFKELLEEEQKQLSSICNQLIKAGVKSLPRRGQSGALDLEAAFRMTERTKELFNHNYENNRSSLMMLAEVGRLVREYIKENRLLEKSKPSTPSEPFSTPSSTATSKDPIVTQTNSPVQNLLPQEPTSPRSLQTESFTGNLNKSENLMDLLGSAQTPIVGYNPMEVNLQSRLAEICILLATKLREAPIKVLQLSRSQLTIASWEVDALLSNENDPINAEMKKQFSSIRRAIALLAEMQETGILFREFLNTGKIKESEEVLLKIQYFLDQAKTTSAQLETQSHQERTLGNYTRAENLAATRQKLLSTHQLLNTIVSWQKKVPTPTLQN